MENNLFFYYRNKYFGKLKRRNLVFFFELIEVGCWLERDKKEINT